MSEHQHDHPDLYCPACVKWGEDRAAESIARAIEAEIPATSSVREVAYRNAARIARLVGGIVRAGAGS